MCVCVRVCVCVCVCVCVWTRRIVKITDISEEPVASILTLSPTMKMEKADSFETSVEDTQHHIKRVNSLHSLECIYEQKQTNIKL
jgi:hypothetical protein